MKTMNKILLAAALVLLGCLAGTKVVKADATKLTLSYTESSNTFKYTFNGEPTNVTGLTLTTDAGSYEITSISQTGTVAADDLLALFDEGEPNGKTYTVDANVTADPGVTVTTTTVKVYTENLTALHGTFDAADPAYGLKGQTYSTTWNQGDEYVFVGWNDGNTYESRSDLKFGTAYSVNTQKISVTVDPKELNGATPAAEQDVEITLSPASADPSLLTYNDTAYTGSCSASWTGDNSNIVTFTNVEGSGSFTLEIYYDGALIKTQKINVRSNITDIVSNSYSIIAGESKNFTITTVPAGGTVECKTTKTPAGVEDWHYSDGSLDIDALANASGNIVFQFTAGSVTRNITIKVVKEEEIDYVEVTGPDEITNKETATYKATVWLKNGKKSTQGVDWTVVSPSGKSTIKKDANGNGVLTAVGDIDDEITVTASAASDDTYYDYVNVTIVDEIEPGELIFKTADSTDTIKISKPYKLNLDWGVGVTADNPNASISSIVYSAKGFSGTSTFTPPSLGTFPVDPDEITIKYKSGSKESGIGLTDGVDIEVIEDWAGSISTVSNSSSSTSDSTAMYKFELKNKEVYTGVDASENITSITGYRIDVLDSDKKVMGGKTFEKSMSTGTINVTLKELNEALEEASDNLSGDSPTVYFRISPYGRTQVGSSTAAKSYNFNTAAARTTDSRKVYKKDGKYRIDSSNSSSSSSSSKSNSAASGSGSGNAGAGLDKVPKTGEGNARLLIIMVAVISATIAGSILLSYMPAKAGAPFRFGRKSNVSEQTADRSESDPKEDHDQKI